MYIVFSFYHHKNDPPPPFHANFGLLNRLLRGQFTLTNRGSNLRWLEWPCRGVVGVFCGAFCVALLKEVKTSASKMPKNAELWSGELVDAKDRRSAETKTLGSFSKSLSPPTLRALPSLSRAFKENFLGASFRGGQMLYLKGNKQGNH